MGVNAIGRLPFDTVFVDAMLAGLTVVEYRDGAVVDGLKGIWDILKFA